jgi:hypothetical protein
VLLITPPHDPEARLFLSLAFRVDFKKAALYKEIYPEIRRE